MKKFFLASLLIFTMFLFVSCVSEDEDPDETNDQSDTSADTGNIDTDSPSDTDPSGTTDPASDTDPSDTTDTSSDDPDTSSGDTDPVVTPDGCIGFSIEPDMKYYQGIYYADVKGDVLGSSSLYDQLTMQFFLVEVTAKTYDLTDEDNRNYSTCHECVRVFEDIDTNNGNKPARQYFPVDGTITVDETDGVNGIRGTITAKLEEVTIDIVTDEDGYEDYVSQPVPGGKCIEIESGFFNNICKPDCDGRICGDDGCGGTCGEGCGTDLACSADQKECVSYECEKVTLSQFSLVDKIVPSYYEYDSSLTPNIGNDAADAFSFQIYYGEYMNKEWDLAAPENSNFKNCKLCLLVSEDQNSRLYFQQRGTVDLSNFKPSDGTLSAPVKDLRLIEVKIDTYEHTSTPVPGGKCIEITNTSFDYHN